MIDERSIQNALAAKGLYKGKIDGVLGPKSRDAIKRAVLQSVALPAAAGWNPARLLVAFQQIMMRDVGIEVGQIDGRVGPQTRFAWEKWQDHLRDADPDNPEIDLRPVWPRQADVEKFFGPVGKNQTRLKLPYPMRVAWAPAQIVDGFMIHEKVHDSVERVLKRVLDHYGPKEITRLGLDLFGGSLNVRKMRGSSRWSMHAWGIAIDFDPEHNQFRWGRDQAEFAKNAYQKFWELWEAEGWLSLGRARNYDWMHVQAARL